MNFKTDLHFLKNSEVIRRIFVALNLLKLNKEPVILLELFHRSIKVKEKNQKPHLTIIGLDLNSETSNQIIAPYQKQTP